jgi:D-sedoheptulose 7-phosphate isomerase
MSILVNALKFLLNVIKRDVMLDWIKNHFNTLYHLQLNTIITDQQGKTIQLDEGFKRYIECVKSIRSHRNKLIMIGNGGSAGVASHLAIDYSKNGRLHAITLSDPSALTCLSNDYGYEHVFEKQIEYHANQGDVLIAISSSGNSENILNAVAAAKAMGCTVITFSGFDTMNRLSQLGYLNFYVPSKEYGFVEVAHLSLGHAMLDYIIQQEAEAPVQQTPSKAALVEEGVNK